MKVKGKDVNELYPECIRLAENDIYQSYRREPTEDEKSAIHKAVLQTLRLLRD